MGSFLESLVPWGYSVIQWIQSFRMGFLDQLFHILTMFGNEEGYMLLLPFIYWCWDAKLGRRLAFVTLTSLGVNSWVKSMFMIPRPSASKVAVLVHEASPSFPSGHAQGTMTFWAYVAHQKNRLMFSLIIAILIFGIGFSRLYLGAHFPQDVLGGWLLSFIVLVLFIKLEPKFLPVFQAQHFALQLFATLILPVALFALNPTKAAATVCGTLFGFSVGILLERRFLKFDTAGTWGQRSLRLLGLIVVVVVWLGLKKVLPEGLLFRGVRYGCVGFTAAFIAPFLFLRLGLAKPESE